MDSSEANGPLVCIQGKGDIIKGLESALLNKKAGDQFHVDIQAEDGYGFRNEGLLFEVPLDNFGENVSDLHVGMKVQMESTQGQFILSVARIGKESVSLDGNHPLAGMTLHFDVNVVDVRDATEDELKHGMNPHCGCENCDDGSNCH